MQAEHIDLQTFKRDTSFYGSLDLWATVKNFDLQSIRARYLKSKQNKNSKTGSVERRAPAEGGIVSFSIHHGKLHSYEVLAKMKEPRGIACYKDKLAYSSENEVYIITQNKKECLKDPWFSYIHTVDFSKDGKQLLVSSSGFDLLLEYDLGSMERISEWWAWEHGFSQGTDPETGEKVTLSRVPMADKKDVRVISDPAKDVLPTAMRAAFINSAEYDRSEADTIIATFFHDGAIYSIDKKTGRAEVVIQDLKNPHGGMRISNGYMGTSTRSGHVVVKDGYSEKRYAFQALPDKPVALEGEEWIQNSKYLDNGCIISIDSNRTCFVIFDPENKLIDMIPYPDNLAVQDLLICSQEQSIAWKKLF